MPKTIKKILEDCWDSDWGVHSFDINKAIHSIKELLREKMPLRKTYVCEFDPRVDIGENNKAERNGYNQALEDMEKIIEGL